jgi:hypothetical protein
MIAAVWRNGLLVARRFMARLHAWSRAKIIAGFS